MEYVIVSKYFDYILLLKLKINLLIKQVMIDDYNGGLYITP